MDEVGTDSEEKDKRHSNAAPTTEVPVGRDNNDEEWQEWQEWKQWKRWNERMKRKATQDSSKSADNEQSYTATMVGSEMGIPREEYAQHIPGNAERQYVLSGQPTGWAALDTIIRDFDEEKVRNCKEDIDTLLVFAGLFSAVLTAFVIESYSTLLEDTAGESLITLRQIAAQTSSYEMRGAFLNSTAIPSPPLPVPFAPSSTNIRINVLWFASLLFSLIAASFGILVKQWLREYLTVQNPSPQARLRVRHLRYPQLAKWQIFEIAAFLPLLLQLSLGLFFIGLCYFTAAAHSSIGYTALPLVAGWAFCLTTVTLLPLFFPRCPYRTTLLKSLFSIFHQVIGRLAIRMDAWTSLQQSRPPASDRVCRIKTLFWEYIHSVSQRMAKEREDSDEAIVVQSGKKDLEILADADAIQSNDDLLGTTIAEAASQVAINLNLLDYLPTFVLRILTNRLAAPSTEDHELAIHTLVINLRATTLSAPAQNAVLDMIEHYYRCLPPADLHTFESSTHCLRSSFVIAVMLSLSGRDVRQIPQLTGLLSSRAMAAHLHSFCCELVRHYHRPSELPRGPSERMAKYSDRTIHRLLAALSSLQDVLDWWVVKLPALLDMILKEYAGRPVESGGQNDDDFNHDDSLMHIPSNLAKWPWQEMPDSLKIAVTKFLQASVQHSIDSSERMPNQLYSGTRHKMLGRFGPQVDTAVVETLVTLFCTARYHGQLSSKTNWRLVVWKLLSLPEGGAITLSSAVGNTPSADILCLVTQVIPTSTRHRFRPQKSSFEAELHHSMLSHWKSVITRGPNSPDPLKSGHILRICCFSIYSLILIHGQQSPNLLQAAWTEIFDLLSDNLERVEKHTIQSLQEPTRSKITKLATACLEIIRHEEINARSWEEWPWSAKEGVLVFRHADSENSLDKVHRMVVQWRVPPLHSVFPGRLITALEQLAEPSWYEPVDVRNAGKSDLGWRCICHDLLCPRICKLKDELLALY